jgi:hypothetical protein
LKPKKQPELISKSLKKYLPKDMLNEVGQIDPEKARAYLKKRWDNKEPKPTPKGQVTQESFDEVFKEQP